MADLARINLDLNRQTAHHRPPDLGYEAPSGVSRNLPPVTIG
jgi:hypothetical protein